MQKQLVIISTISMLIFVGLCGCNEQQNIDVKSKFIGTWIHERENGFRWTLITNFYENNSFHTITIRAYQQNETTTSQWGSYEVINNKLNTTAYSNNIPVSYNYTFSDSDKILTLTPIHPIGNTIIYTKQ